MNVDELEQTTEYTEGRKNQAGFSFLCAPCNPWFWSLAILMGYGELVRPNVTFLFTHALVRRNIVWRLDGLPDSTSTPDYKSAALAVSGCTNLVVEENVVTSANPKPIRYQLCTNQHFFDNKAPSGTPVPGVQTSPVVFTNPEISNDVQDSEVLAI